MGGGGWRGLGGKTPLHFCLSTLNDADAEWLTLGCKEGQLMEADVQVGRGLKRGCAASFFLVLSLDQMDQMDQMDQTDQTGQIDQTDKV